MEVLFAVDPRLHGTGSVVFSWQRQGKFLASTGNSRVVHIFDKRGEIVDQIVPHSPSIVTALEWNYDGNILAIVQANSSQIIFWDESNRKTTQLDIGIKDITFIKWSKVESWLAVGTNRGIVITYNYTNEEKFIASVKHKKRIMAGDWNLDNKLAYASDDRQITICRENGVAVDQVKVKCRPFSVKFGGKENEKDRIVSVNMEGKTILLYDLMEQHNALELAFQSKYGKIVSYQWFGNGYIIAGFSSGFVVIISTHLHEIGQEQYCANLFNDQLIDLAFCERTNMLASCGDQALKVINITSDWKEVASEELEKETGDSFDRIAWTNDGKYLSVSTRLGCLYTFVLPSVDDGTGLSVASTTLWEILLQPLTVPAALGILAIMALVFVLGSCYYLQIEFTELVRAMIGFRQGL